MTRRLSNGGYTEEAYGGRGEENQDPGDVE